MILRLTLIAVLATFTTVGCSFVNKTDGGKKVRVLAIAEVETCRKLGKISAAVSAKVAGIARPSETVQEELNIIGRNNAAEMGGDTIVPATTKVDGTQSFHVYKCIDPNSR